MLVQGGGGSLAATRAALLSFAVAVCRVVPRLALQNNATQKDDTLRALEARGKHARAASSSALSFSRALSPSPYLLSLSRAPALRLSRSLYTLASARPRHAAARPGGSSLGRPRPSCHRQQCCHCSSLRTADPSGKGTRGPRLSFPLARACSGQRQRLYASIFCEAQYTRAPKEGRGRQMRFGATSFVPRDFIDCHGDSADAISEPLYLSPRSPRGRGESRLCREQTEAATFHPALCFVARALEQTGASLLPPSSCTRAFGAKSRRLL